VHRAAAHRLSLAMASLEKYHDSVFMPGEQTRPEMDLEALPLLAGFVPQVE
jgi:hypothetical protein